MIRLTAVVLNHTGAAQGADHDLRTEYAYDALGRRTALTDANGHSTAYAYDTLGRLRTQTDALEHATGWEYDALGRVTRVTDANGQVSERSYYSPRSEAEWDDQRARHRGGLPGDGPGSDLRLRPAGAAHGRHRHPGHHALRLRPPGPAGAGHLPRPGAGRLHLRRRLEPHRSCLSRRTIRQLCLRPGQPSERSDGWAGGSGELRLPGTAAGGREHAQRAGDGLRLRRRGPPDGDHAAADGEPGAGLAVSVRLRRGGEPHGGDRDAAAARRDAGHDRGRLRLRRCPAVDRGSILRWRGFRLRLRRRGQPAGGHPHAHQHADTQLPYDDATG